MARTGRRVTLQTCEIPQRRMTTKTTAAKNSAAAKAASEPLYGRNEGLVLHVLRREGENEDEDAADCGVGPEEPSGRPSRRMRLR